MNSNERIINILFRLLSGESLNNAELAALYKVDIRTIQRDMSAIKTVGESFDYQLNKESASNNYTLTNSPKLVFEDTLAITKILLASRAFQLEEMQQLLTNLIRLNPIEDAEAINDSIKNELVFYYPLEHEISLLNRIKEIEQLILDKKIVRITYQKNDGSVTLRDVLPISIFFSDYYFYAICYELDKQRYINLRIDRFVSLKQKNERFTIPYKDRLEEKDLREQMILMQYGNKLTFSFRFFGIVEAALDKFPNSKIVTSFEDGSVEIKATAYDKGAIMWLLSQGSRVHVVSPPSFVKQMKREIEEMGKMY